ncbi:MAG: GlxA family transcriptional regulator [Granulosicoccus sp.]
MTSADYRSFGVVDEDAEQEIGFFLPDTFAILPFISALEPLRAANRFSGRALYRWHLYGEEDRAAIANNALAIDVNGTLQQARQLHRLIVCGAHEPHLFENSAINRTLRRIASSGTPLGALDTGSYLLAQAGLIRNRRCTIHWENLPGFRNTFPEIKVFCELFEVDDNLFTCAGGAAALDMMLALIGKDHGIALAAQIADLFIHTTTRNAHDSQRPGTAERTGIHHPGLINCIELMEANIEQPLSTAELASMTNISTRQLERLFRANLHTTPTLYYLELRLHAGRELLRQSGLSVLEVATATGFASADYFSRRFRTRYSFSPSDARFRR